MLPGSHKDLHDESRNGSIDIGLHFHGFESEKFCAAFHCMIRLHGDTTDDPRGWSGHLAGIGGGGLGGEDPAPPHGPPPVISTVPRAICSQTNNPHLHPLAL